MITEILLKYLEYTHYPIIKSDEREQFALDDYGDCVCPYCDCVIKSENNVIRIGDKCWKCGSEVIRFDEY